MVQLYNLQFGGPEHFQIWTNYIFYIISPQPNTITQKRLCLHICFDGQ